MSTPRQHQKSMLSDKESSSGLEMLARRLLPIAARKKIASGLPVNAGVSFFYDVDKGWETDMLRRDEEICIAYSPEELECALRDTHVKTVLVPYRASITRELALAICKRNNQPKTIFFETA